MIGPVARGARAPLAGAAAIFAVGVAAGGWSVAGERLAAAAALAALVGSAFCRRPLARVCAETFLLAAGFSAGRSRVAKPAAEAFRTFSHIDPDRPVGITGVLDDPWTGAAGLLHSRISAEAIEQGGVSYPFHAPVTIHVFGGVDPAGVRGDRVRAVAALEAPEDAVSTRDLPSPIRVYRATVKSGWQTAVAGATLRSAAGAVNAFLARRLAASGLPDGRVVRPLDALLLGRTGDLDEPTAETIRRGGAAHILLATGLHAALAAGLVFGALAVAGIRGKGRDAATLLAVAAFSAVAGAGPSISRVALTIGFLLIARWLELPVSLLQAVGASALVVLAADPTALWRFGFWITYGASAGIALLAGPLAEMLARVPERIRGAVAVVTAAQLVAAPLVFWRFNTIGLGAWLLAPGAIVIAALLMLAGGAALFAAAAGLPAALPGAAFGGLYSGVEWLAARFHGATFLGTTPPLAGVAALLALASTPALLRRREARWAALAAYGALLAAMAVRRGPAPDPGTFSVEGLDVGQGDAFLLRSGDAAFLVDGGGSFSGAEDFGRTRLLPKLLDRGVRRLDGALLSHPHPDHAAGLLSVLRELPTATFYRGDGEDAEGWFARLETAAAEAGCARRIVKTGERISWAGGTFDVLRSGGIPFKKDTINNESVVLMYTHGSRRVLLTGDAGLPAEREILDRLGRGGPIDVLKVGHHGSRTSSGEDFVAAFAPRAALLSCGRRNRYHHPSIETMRTFARLRVPVFRTDLRSDVGILLTPEHLFLRERGRP